MKVLPLTAPLQLQISQDISRQRLCATVTQPALGLGLFSIQIWVHCTRESFLKEMHGRVSAPGVATRALTARIFMGSMHVVSPLEGSRLTEQARQPGHIPAPVTHQVN